MKLKVIANVVGVVSAFIALAPTARAATDLGGVNILNWCQNQQLSSNTVGVDVDPHDAFSWKCVYTSATGSVTKTRVIIDDACTQQYPGGPAWSKPLDPHDPYSWHCYR
jgi:hypothetical protein